MEATRIGDRLGSALEWLVAAAFLLATLVVGSLIVRELRTSAPAAAVPAQQEIGPATLPAGVPARATSVPVLLLFDGSQSRQVRVGDSVDEVARVMGRAAETGAQLVDRGAIGERLTRFYDYRGTRFILVFEPFERGGSLRVAAIYLQ